MSTRPLPARRLVALVVSATLFACAAPEKPAKSETSGRVVGVKELPPEHAELLRVYARGGPEWERARAAALADPELARFLVDNLTLEMVRAHRAMGGNDFQRAKRAYERAQAELVRTPELSVPVLIALLEVADPVAAEVASQTLADIGRPAVEPTLALLSAEKPDPRRHAALLLGELPHAGSQVEARVRDEMAARLRSEPDWLARTALARSIGARGSRDSVVTPWREALEAGLADPDPAVCEASAEGLAVLADERAVPALIETLDRSAKSGDMTRFQASQRALVRITREGEKPSVAAWREWWASRRR